MFDPLAVDYSPFLKDRFPAKATLARALLACPSIHVQASRETLFNQLPPGFRGTIRHTADANTDVLNWIDASLNYEGGLNSLLEVVFTFESLGGDESIGWKGVKDALRLIVNPGALPARFRDQLLDLLPENAVGDDLVASAYRASLPPDVNPLPGKVTVRDVVGQLGDLQPAGTGVGYPVLGFVEHLAHGVAVASLRDSLRAWSGKRAEHFKLSPVHLDDFRRGLAAGTVPGASARYFLLVEVSPSARGDEDRFDLRAVLWRGRDPVGEPFATGEPVTLDRAKAVVTGRVLAAAKTLGKAELVVEFSLPLAWLAWDVEQWPLYPADDLPIGIYYPVVVRWHAQYDRVDRLPGWWMQRWDRFQTAAAAVAAAAPVFWVDRPDEHPKLAPLCALLMGSPDWFCVGLAFVPPVDSAAAPAESPRASLCGVPVTLLKVCFLAGLPVAVWFRRDPAAHHSVRAELEELFKDNRLRELPTQALRLRRAGAASTDPANPRRDLTVVWDDPYRMTPSFSQPANE